MTISWDSLFFTGDLLPRHIEIFSKNPFFKGLTIPEPENLVSSIIIVSPLHKKFLNTQIIGSDLICLHDEWNDLCSNVVDLNICTL